MVSLWLLVLQVLPRPACPAGSSLFPDGRQGEPRIDYWIASSEKQKRVSHYIGPLDYTTATQRQDLQSDSFTEEYNVNIFRFWLTEEILDDWMLASVTLIHGQVWKEDPGNYRPVSLMLVPSKVMEQIILSGITMAPTGQPGDQTQPAWI
ncbi:hypothetical protein WISP_03383 [Willisornis vidua]|uniref:Uncharacterized protein n=1 Tax=Willisornis vidua TaxID=1566151 RepID=A0ABQ9DUB2_9PASS|nr:hypothetical protein WISP_03383 [Willisornis vidua]